ncbi:MAG: hypothetical protein K0S65_3056 [Labilithrix sp.]|nr:hypothetical protein [Labilithrix sp.]
MVRARAVAICVALLAMAPSARAQPHIVERLRLQGGVITEKHPPPNPRIEDLWVSAVPELSATWLTPRATINITYSLTGALHSLGSASEIANRLVLTSAYELSNRTNLLLSAEGAQTTASNFLIQRPAADSPIALYPAAGTRFLTGRFSQGLRHELSPVLTASQEASVLTTTTLAPAPPLDTFVATLSGGIERSWRNDALGAELRGGYAQTRATPPTPSAEVFTITAAPRWRHDWSRSLSSSAAAGATYLFSPDPNTDTVVAPFGQANLLYSIDPTELDLAYSIGVFPSPLTGQILRSQQVVLHARTPISEHHRVYIGGSIGYLRATLLDLVSTANDQSFHAFFSDIDLTWQATSRVQIFGRYQTITQLADINAAGVNPSFIRDAVIVGVQLSSEGAQITVPTRFAQRVDGADAPLRPALQNQPQAQGEDGAPANNEEAPGRPAEDDETNTSGGSVEGMPGMWRTRPSRPAGEPTPGRAPAPPNRPRR